MSSVPTISALSMLPSVSRPLPAIDGHPGAQCLARLALRPTYQLAREGVATNAEREAVRIFLPMIRDALKPADPKQVAFWVEFLMSRYRGRPDAPSFSIVDKQMWLRSIGHWPLDVLEAAITQWCDEERPFAPSVPGEVKALGQPIYNKRRALLGRGEELLLGPDAVEREYVSAEDLRALEQQLYRRALADRPDQPSDMRVHFAAGAFTQAPIVAIEEGSIDG